MATQTKTASTASTASTTTKTNEDSSGGSGSVTMMDTKAVEDNMNFLPFLIAYLNRLYNMIRNDAALSFQTTDVTTDKTKSGDIVPLCGDDEQQRPLYTRIHGKWYNLRPFMSSHPGGPVMLMLAENRDATVLFESHHYLADRPKLEKVMEKYQVKDTDVAALKLFDPTDGPGHYDWNFSIKDQFATEVQGLVLDYFQGEAKRRGVSVREATKASFRRWVEIIFFLGCFYLTLPFFVRGEWWTLLATPLLGWIASVNYWHDSLHCALSTNWRINAYLPYLFPWFSSPYTWYHQHLIGHHCHPNVGSKDPDLFHAPRLMREHESIPWRESHADQATLTRMGIVWTAGSGYGLSFLSDVKANVGGKYNSVVPYRMLHGQQFYLHTLGRVFYVFTIVVWPFWLLPLYKAMLFAFVPIGIFSVCFMINSQINHLTHDTAHASSESYYRHQVVTAQNFGNDSAFCYYASGGLNYQIEHHLFPCVNHCHWPVLSKRIKEVCKKHGVAYLEAKGYWDALKNHLVHTAKMAVRPTKGRKEE